MISARYRRGQDPFSEGVGEHADAAPPFFAQTGRGAASHAERVGVRMAADDMPAQAQASNLRDVEKPRTVDVARCDEEMATPAEGLERIRNCLGACAPVV